MAKRLLPHQPSEDGPHPDDEPDSPAIEAAALDIPPQAVDPTGQKGELIRIQSAAFNIVIYAYAYLSVLGELQSS